MYELVPPLSPSSAPRFSSSPSSAVVPVQVCVEYEVLSYLHSQGLPVPKPYHLESREGVIGTEFFIMEYVDVSQGVLQMCVKISLSLCVCVCVCVCVACLPISKPVSVLRCILCSGRNPFLFLILRASFSRTTASLPFSLLSEGRFISP